MTRRVLRALAVVAVVGAAAAALLRNSPPPRRTGPVVLVGLDGFEWRIALPLMRRGELPELLSLATSGVAGTLTTLRPTTSPALWTSIATGRPMKAHGIRDFLKSKEPPPILNTSRDRRCKAFWNILTDAGRSSVTIGWWLTYPVEPVNGLMVAQSNTLQAFQARGILKGALEAGLEDQVHPPERQAAFLDVAQSMNESLPQLVDAFLTEAKVERATLDAKDLDESGWALRADATYQRIAEDVIGKGEPADVVAVYFGLTDVLAHRFWKHGGPAADERHEYSAFEKGSVLIPAAYRRADRVVGALRRKLPPGSTILVVSDHGMRPEGHEDAPKSFFVASGPGIRATGFDPQKTKARDLAGLGSILDVLPTLLALLGMPAASDMPGRPLEEVVTPEVFEARPPRIATYDDEKWLASRAALNAAPDGEQDEERLEQLRGLGYIN
jgi:predicted AlkP superfamily phosphohydrolase/phosphomutase